MCNYYSVYKLLVESLLTVLVRCVNVYCEYYNHMLVYCEYHGMSLANGELAINLYNHCT